VLKEAGSIACGSSAAGMPAVLLGRRCSDTTSSNPVNATVGNKIDAMKGLISV